MLASCVVPVMRQSSSSILVCTHVSDMVHTAGRCSEVCIMLPVANMYSKQVPVMQSTLHFETDVVNAITVAPPGLRQLQAAGCRELPGRVAQQLR